MLVNYEHKGAKNVSKVTQHQEHVGNIVITQT